MIILHFAVKLFITFIEIMQVFHFRLDERFQQLPFDLFNFIGQEVYLLLGCFDWSIRIHEPFGFGQSPGPVGVHALRSERSIERFNDNDIFQQILRFGNQLRVEPDMSRSVIATSPLGFHSLEEVLFDADLQFWLPFADKFRDDLMQKGLMPFMHHFRPFLGIAAGSYAKSDASMVERNGRLSIQEGNAQKITPSPMFAFVRGELAAQAKDYWQAACWYYIATINGHPRAAVSFGEMRRKRLGVTKDPEDALNCMEIGGREGDYLGAAIASEMYKNGEGTAPNPQKAAEWLAKAKELKAKQDQEEAKERKEETEYQAELHALEIIGEAGAKMFMNELRRSPECDVMCSQSDYSNGSCASRIQQRDSDLANHKINCDATIPEF